MEISNRLRTIASMVTSGNVVCDVGTDHGYLAIYLIEQHIASKVIAMDIAKGPLQTAAKNINATAFASQITIRQSDGVKKLSVGEADTIVVAGMGGMLICDIIEAGISVFKSVKEIILSPHRDVANVRRYLLSNGFVITDEKMVFDEGKYYFILKTSYSGNGSDYTWNNDFEINYGKYLLEKRDTIFYDFLLNQQRQYKDILEKLSVSDSDNAKLKLNEVEKTIHMIKEGLSLYEM